MGTAVEEQGNSVIPAWISGIELAGRAVAGLVEVRRKWSRSFFRLGACDVCVA